MPCSPSPGDTEDPATSRHGTPPARVTQAMISGMLMPGQGPAPSLPGSLRPPSSHNLVMKHLPGADPELVLLSFRYEELEVRAGWVWGRRGAPGYFCPSLSQQGALQGAGWQLWLWGSSRLLVPAGDAFYSQLIKPVGGCLPVQAQA